MSEFFQQPDKWDFIELIQAPRKFHYCWTPSVTSAEPEILHHFDDPENLLSSAVDSLRRFMKEAIPFHFPVTLRLARRKWIPETYELETMPASAQITGAGLEGVRRGIYALIRMWESSPSPQLPERKIRRSPWLKNRISRCYFSPINRPPANRDELLDDEDYYPEPYLDRLAASGINVLWISAELRQLCGTRFTGPPAPDALRRIAKLRRIVERCRRYGIRIFLQMNEPVAFPLDDPLYRDHPLFKGVERFGRACFCPSSPEAEAYLEESFRNLFASVEHLGGILNITLGEGLTTCASADPAECPRCSRLPWKEILHRTWRAMRRGIDASAPDAELVSWLYLPEAKELDERILQLLEGVPERVIVQLNCDSGGEMVQNGKCRRVGDYWLSMDQPSSNFIRFAETAERWRVPVSAKIQVGCSHEVASVPFVPVPGLLYRKYRALRKLKVSSVMQCWYFGNYPGLMNGAAGELAFEPFDDTEEDFLLRLARFEWGKHAARVAGIWRIFGEAYRHYPASNMFQYYGPVTDGVSWPLHFQVQNRGLTPTWLLEPEINGDDIVEALMEIPMKDAITQMKTLSRLWHRGAVRFSALRGSFAGNRDRLLDIGLAEALDILFDSARNILEFYQARSRMIRIAGKEAANTRRMLQLTENDPRLGFHSEAEGYKFYPDKLRWRLQQLLPENNRAAYRIGSGWVDVETFRWRADSGPRPDHLSLVVELDGILPGMDEFFVALDDCGTTFPALLHVSSRKIIFVKAAVFQCKLESSVNGWKIFLDIAESAYSKQRPLRINLVRLTDLYRKRFSWPEAGVSLPGKLNLVFYQPANMGYLIQD